MLAAHHTGGVSDLGLAENSSCLNHFLQACHVLYLLCLVFVYWSGIELTNCIHGVIRELWFSGAATAQRCISVSICSYLLTGVCFRSSIVTLLQLEDDMMYCACHIICMRYQKIYFPLFISVWLIFCTLPYQLEQLVQCSEGYGAFHLYSHLLHKFLWLTEKSPVLTHM